MSTWYREIEPIQEPFEISHDNNERTRIIFNIRAIKGASATFVEEITKLLEDAGVGTFNVDIFAGSNAKLPDGDGPFLSIIETGGTFPERTQNEIVQPAFQRPYAQLVARASEYVTARAMARAAYDALVGIRNIAVTP